MQSGEGVFKFYDEASPHCFEVYRELLNSWIDKYPEPDRAELIARFRSDPSQKFYETLPELVVHEAFSRRVHRIEYHPKIEGSGTRPDFRLVSTDGQTIAFVEVTTIGFAKDKISKSNQAAKITAAINTIKMPKGCFFSYRLIETGVLSPGLKGLLSEICAWVHGNSERRSEAEARVFKISGWEIELTLHVTDSETAFERAIGMYGTEARWIDPSTDLRRALERKGGRYGRLNAPYLIAVADCKGELAWGTRSYDEVVQALFGDVVYQYRLNEENGGFRRGRNGFFGYPESPKRSHVSSILILPQPDIWGLRNPNHQPFLIKNPWAIRPLPPGLLPVPGVELVQGTEFEPVEGEPFADLIGLPEIWPPPR